MLGAFAYLTLTSARNRFTRQLRRLRSPRYVLALLLALGYFALILGRPHDPGAPGRVFLVGAAEPLAALGLVALAAYWWVLGSDATALAFTPAELQFLFPAPISRRQLVQFKLIRAQLVILVNIVIWSLLLRRGAGEGALALLRPISLWVLFSTLQLHRLGATLSRASAAEHGGAGLRRSAVAFVVVAAVLATVGWALLSAWPADGLTLARLEPTLRAATERPPASWALLPARLLVAPLFVTDAAAWARAIGPAALVMLAHFAWVVRADAAFEDAAVEASEARARRAVARRGGGAETPRARGGLRARLALRLPLRPVGDPAVAIFWKNMHAVARGDRFFRQLLFFAIAVLVLSVVAFVRPTTAAVVLGVIVAWGGMLVLLGPLWLRNDLRGDLPRLEVLRTYPVPPARLVAAELASSATVLTVLELLLGAALFVAMLRAPEITQPMADRVAIGAAIALALPAINLLSASIHNTVALLFPAWIPIGAERKPGIEAMGQMYLTLFAALVVLALLLALPAAAGALVAASFWHAYGLWSLLPAVVVGSAVAAGELAFIVARLGRAFERVEPAEVEG